MKKSHKKNSRHVANLRGSNDHDSRRKSPKYLSRNRENASGVSNQPRHQTFDVNIGNDQSTGFDFTPVADHRPQGK